MFVERLILKEEHSSAKKAVTRLTDGLCVSFITGGSLTAKSIKQDNSPT